MRSLFSGIFFISLILLSFSCVTTDMQEKQSEHTLRFPGPAQANEILISWEKSIVDKNKDLFLSLFHQPVIEYINSLGDEIVFTNRENVAYFRFEYFGDLGNPEDYQLPGKPDEFNGGEWGYFYKFSHHDPDEILEMISISRDNMGVWGIDWVKYIALTPGPYVTNQLAACADLNDDGFLTEEDDWLYGRLQWELFKGPHPVDSFMDEYFDKNRDSIISSDELVYAADTLIVKAMVFSRQAFGYEVPEKDYNGDSVIDKDDIYAMRNLVLRGNLSEPDFHEMARDFWWVALPDFLLSSTPREVNSYLDYLGDGDGNGLISREEQQLMESTFTIYKTERNYFHDALDRNRDGELQWNELNLAMMISAKNRSYIDLTAPPYPANTPLDKLLDLSGDAMIDADEIKTLTELIVSADGNLLPEGILRNLIDSDRDHKIASHEIQRFKADYFYPRAVNPGDTIDYESDADSNGYIDIQEVGLVAGYAGGSLVSTIDKRITALSLREDNGSEGNSKKKLPLGKSIVVLDVDTENSSVVPETGKILRVFIENAFINRGGAPVLDRENLGALTEEMNLQASGLVDEATAVQLGKLIGAELVGKASLSELNGVIYLNLKLIEVETAEILSSTIANMELEGDFFNLAHDAVRMVDY
ncbi:MAG: hypothetical protein JXR86_14545 [Spirochaetales bacterium]|nr:hypothetical protein [Spirochaetales bacterium]